MSDTVNMISVTSSNVRSIGYDDENATLHVVFKDNAHYIYKGVPADDFAALKNASSIGSHLHRCIKSTYPCSRVK